MPNYAKRRDNLRKLVRKLDVDAFLVTNFVNVTYLTGFTGDDSFLLLQGDREILLSDPRYTEQLQEECPDVTLEIRRPPKRILDSIEKVVKKLRIRNLGVEAAAMTLATADKIDQRLKNVDLVPTENLVEQLRQVKDGDEVKAIRKAVKIAEQALEAFKASLTSESTEKALADDLEHTIRKLGGACTSFPPIVAVGPRAALPHARPTAQARVGDGALLLVDWGAQAPLYKSDLTRVLATAKISPKLERIYGVVLKAQLAAIDAIRPGALMCDVDRAARQVIEEAGFGSKFGHGLGHGIGLDIHEAPRLAADEETPLEAGMVVTVEPGIYLPGWGGVRIEDDVLVRRDGHEALSSTPKELEACVVDIS